MPSPRFRLAAAVYGVLSDGDNVLFMRRERTGYHDGELGLPSGHLDGGEDALSALVRELEEELDITTQRESCQLALVMHRPAEWDGDNEYVDLFFTVGHWDGSPRIAEPDKCSELIWAARDELPADVVGYIASALQAIDPLRSGPGQNECAGERLLLHGWNSATQHGAPE